MADKTQKTFDKIIHKMAEVVKLINEDMEDTDTEMFKVDELNDEIAHLTIEISDKENDFLSYKDLDKYCANLLGKNYFYDKRCWDYLHDSLYDVFHEMNNVIDDELEEEMQTGLGMVQELPTNSTYDGGIFDIYNNDEEEKKDMDKRLKESFKAPKDWDFDDMLDDYGMEYLQENDSDDEPIDMDNFDEYLDGPWEAVRSAFYGGRWGFDRDSFNPTDPFFRFNGYGNVESIPYLDDYLKDIIDEEEFYDWCVDQGYFESDEDNE